MRSHRPVLSVSCCKSALNDFGIASAGHDNPADGGDSGAYERTDDHNPEIRPCGRLHNAGPNELAGLTEQLSTVMPTKSKSGAILTNQ